MNLVAGCTSTKSQASARWAPGPTAVPLTAATVGLSSSQSSRMKAWTPLRSASLVERGSKPVDPAWLTVEARRSIPEQNDSPVPVSRSDLTASSARAWRTASTRSSRMATVSAFLASGRSRVIRPT